MPRRDSQDDADIPKVCASQDATCCCLLRTDKEWYRLTDVDNRFLIVLGHDSRCREDIDLRVLRQGVKHCVQFAGEDAVFQAENLIGQPKIGRSPLLIGFIVDSCALFPHPFYSKHTVVIKRHLNNLCFNEDLRKQNIKLFDQFFNGGEISDKRGN